MTSGEIITSEERKTTLQLYTRLLLLASSRRYGLSPAFLPKPEESSFITDLYHKIIVEYPIILLEKEASRQKPRRAMDMISRVHGMIPRLGSLPIHIVSPLDDELRGYTLGSFIREGPNAKPPLTFFVGLGVDETGDLIPTICEIPGMIQLEKPTVADILDQNNRFYMHLPAEDAPPGMLQDIRSLLDRGYDPRS
jgi:hypothetical protein